ncbi:hypothetical protein WI72_25270 [Burkholderia ubonensis]|uniref:hypothetical protein n=1 Tax=Burkholderia ubonensis TaxID=101571 RepID=UPI0007559A49|nr:hypothetical protein [Burkholderia ubonensis]KUZ78320.1 hypothetical protein WI37_11320 [Burkholderia ubonensis]KVC50907.1 hypothetical protein WI72_25270 [Burkholderia ubonensis]
MATITLEIPDSVLLEALQASAAAEVDLSDLIITRLTASADFDEAPETAPYNAEELAQTLYQVAGKFVIGSKFTVEELHIRQFGPQAWKSQTAGQRIALGRAFRKLAEARTDVVTANGGFPIGFVVFEKKDAQNRAIYSFQNSRSHQA